MHRQQHVRTAADSMGTLMAILFTRKSAAPETRCREAEARATLEGTEGGPVARRAVLEERTHCGGFRTCKYVVSRRWAGAGAGAGAGAEFPRNHLQSPHIEPLLLAAAGPAMADAVVAREGEQEVPDGGLLDRAVDPLIGVDQAKGVHRRNLGGGAAGLTEAEGNTGRRLDHCAPHEVMACDVIGRKSNSTGT